MLAQISLGLLLMVNVISATSPFRLPAYVGPPPPSFPVHPPMGPHLTPPPLPGQPPKERSKKNASQIVESFHVRSDIRYRFATTQMSSVVRNVDNEAQEIGFDVTLPKEAFIMAFHMTIDGKRYDGQVKERLQAKREYQAAVDRGQSAGHVRQAPRHANVFEVSVNVAAGSAVNFTLTYQEMLRRRLGVYEHEIHVNPGQPVEDFVIEVQIKENRALKFVKTPALKTDYILTNELGEAEEENELTIVDRPNPETATVLYKPSVSQQGDDGQGISARFSVQYDVEHGGPGGDVLVVDGYFVHFMAPDNLQQTLPKDIIFVLDVSGSMYGEKIQQLREAMATILSDLLPKDHFNIITFSSGITRWKEGLVPANETNIATATSYVQGMAAGGLTNINDALLTALSEMKGRQNKDRVGMIFFLTDGHPTEGEQDPTRIARNIVNANERTVAIFSLAFGEGADYESLKSLSAQNLGFARKIYEASDADLQVSSLYKEISAVAIKDMSVKYQKSTVDEFSLTQTEFPIVFNGTEIMICGYLGEDAETLKYEITGVESVGKLDISAELDDVDMMLVGAEETNNQLFTGPRDFSGIVERMWAYQTIRQLLREKEKHGADKSKVEELEQKILDMSLKYKFVTPLTSMVVTKPDEGETEVKEAKLNPDMRMESAPSFSYPQSLQGSGYMHAVAPGLKSAAGANGPVSFDPSFQARASNKVHSPIARPTASAWHKKRKFRKSTTTTTPRPPTSPSTTTVAAKTTSPAVSPDTIKFTALWLATIAFAHDSRSPDSALPVCMVPKRWKFRDVLLFSSPDGTRIVLNQCSWRKCKKQPSLESLRFERGSEVTDIRLDGGARWRYTSSAAFSITVLSNTELRVSAPGLTATIDWTQQGEAANYRIQLDVVSADHYLGLMGDLLSQPEAQLRKLSKKRAIKLCKAEGSSIPVLIKRSKARQFNVKKARKQRKNKKSRSNQN